MDKRTITPVVLTASGVALAVAIAVLLIKVSQAAPEPTIDPSELARAKAMARTPPPSAPPPRQSSTRPPARPPEPSRKSSTVGAAWVDDSARKKQVSIENLGPGGLAGAAAGEAVSPADSQVDLREQKLEATRLYDRGDYEGAYAVTAELLADTPDDVKLLRIATAASCIMGNFDKARAHYQALPARDQRQIGRKCAKYGIEF